MTLIPRTQILKQQSVRISSSQYRGPKGVTNFIPRLSFHRILPATSPVFKLVSEGRLKEFQILVGSGEIRLTDQDEYGATFLHYASHHGHPLICKYLIEGGADPDYLSGFINHTGGRVLTTPLAAYKYIDDEMPTDFVSRTFACRKILLDAGGDPTIEVQVGSKSSGRVCLAEWSLLSGVTALTKILFDSGNCFINANELIRGWPPLFYLCELGHWTRESLAVLLDRGADVKFCDKYGRTCLHLCLDVTQPTYSTPLRPQRDGLVYLIQNGADVSAVDNQGKSVSDYAYASKAEWHGSKTGDLWDAALVASGYSVERFRQGRPMLVKLASHYTRWDFDEVWKGLEHLRPHYDMVESWSETDSGDESQPSDYSEEDFEDDEDPDGFGTENDSDSDDGGVPVVDPRGFELDNQPSNSDWQMVRGRGNEDHGNFADDKGSENGEVEDD